MHGNGHGNGHSNSNGHSNGNGDVMLLYFNECSRYCNGTSRLDDSNVIFNVIIFWELKKLFKIHTVFLAVFPRHRHLDQVPVPAQDWHWLKRTSQNRHSKVLITTFIRPVLTGLFQSVLVLCRDRHLIQLPMQRKDRKKYFIFLKTR